MSTNLFSTAAPLYSVVSKLPQDQLSRPGNIKLLLVYVNKKKIWKPKSTVRYKKLTPKPLSMLARGTDVIDLQEFMRVSVFTPIQPHAPDSNRGLRAKIRLRYLIIWSGVINAKHFFHFIANNLEAPLPIDPQARKRPCLDEKPLAWCSLRVSHILSTKTCACL